MTLEPYGSAKLDALSLRVLDVACALREMSVMCRDNEIDKLVLHDKKALEWLARLEGWAREGSARLQTAVIKQRALQRALASVPSAPRQVGAERASAADFESGTEGAGAT